MTSHSEAIDAIDAIDLSNLRAVRRLYAHVDPVPPGLTERMKFAITVQALHAEVAELMDSALLVTRQSDARTEPTPTDSVTFTAASVSLMVTATSDEDDDRLTIDGWVTVPGALIEVVTTEETRSEVADANGRFVLDDVPHGPVHFVILTDPEDPAVRPVITPTIQV